MYILGMNPFLDLCIANVFSMACFFTLLMVSFDKQKLLILKRPDLLIFPFVVSVTVSCLRNICLAQSQNILWCNLEMLFFCFLHWGLWSIYNWFLYKAEVKVYFLSICISNWSSIVFKQSFFLHCIAVASLL